MFTSKDVDAVLEYCLTVAVFGPISSVFGLTGSASLALALFLERVFAAVLVVGDRRKDKTNQTPNDC